MSEALRHCGVYLLIGTGAVIACHEIQPRSAPAQSATTIEPISVTSPQPEQLTSNNVPWLTQEAPRIGPTINGEPVAMAPGKHCLKFRTLPALEFHRNTLIRDACLEIPSNTTIILQSGLFLGIVATNGLRLGKNIKVSANGSQGMRGQRADFGSVNYTPNSDVEVQATCVDNGNRCSCPAGGSLSAASLRGHAGGSGTPGGFVSLVIGELVSSGELVGLDIDVGGGRGGPPGESGKQVCRRGEVQCSSQPCSDGVTNGSSGAHGHVYVALGGSNAAKLLRIVSAATMPSNAITTIPITSKEALQAEATALSDKAYQNDWDQRSGRDPI